MPSNSGCGRRRSTWFQPMWGRVGASARRLVRPGMTPRVCAPSSSLDATGTPASIAVSLVLSAPLLFARDIPLGEKAKVDGVITARAGDSMSVKNERGTVVARLGLSDSLWALVVTYPTFLVPFCTWLLMGYFRTVPKEIEECAMLDGCSRLQSMLFILLPAAVPGVICAALFAFTLSWNEFLYSLVFVSPAELKTMTVGVFSELIRGDIYYWGALMAGATIGSLPIVVAYVFFLDYYVSGLTSGAIK